MIVGEDLAAWLGDERRQQASAERIQALRARWQEHPALIALGRAVATAGGKAASLIEAAAAFFDSVGEADDLMRAMIRAAAEDPFVRPPFRVVATDTNSGLLLFDSPEMMVSLSIVRVEPLAARKTVASGPTSIIFSGQWSALRMIRSGGATFSFWEAPPVGEGFAAETAGRCRLAGRRRIVDGETILLDGCFQSFVIDHAAADMIFLQASISAEGGPLTVEYDSRSHEFVAASSADESGSRMEMMASLLRLLDAREAIPVIAEIIAQSRFNTRWHLMRELLAWDPEAALPHLRAMAAADPHLEVRAAAAETLALFFEDVPCRA